MTNTEIGRHLNRSKRSVDHKLSRLGFPGKPKAEGRRASKLKAKYGMSISEYDLLWEDQEGLCAICGQPETMKHQNGSVLRLSVDHSHKTGKVRGLLCRQCNLMIGHAQDKPDILLKGAAYLGR